MVPFVECVRTGANVVKVQTDLRNHGVAPGGCVRMPFLAVAQLCCICFRAGANDVVAQTDLCNHGDALGGDVVALQTDLHCGECAPGVCDGIVSCHDCILKYARVERRFVEAAETEDAAR